MKYRFEDWQAGKRFPKLGFDVADLCDSGWNREQIDTFMRATVKPWSPPTDDKPADKREERREQSAGAEQPAKVDTLTSEPEIARPVIDMQRREDMPSKKNDDRYPDDIPTGSSVRLRDHPLRDGILALREWVFLSGDCEFYNHVTGDRMSKTAFDLSMAPITPMVEIQKNDGSLSSKKYPSSRTLIEFLDGKIVSSRMYRPDVPDEFFEVDGIRYVNSYMPRTVPAADPNWQSHDAWKICEDHINTMFPDDGKVLIKWMAHNVQFPGRKITWSPVLVGVQGDGKTTTINMLRAAMGVANVQDVSQEALFSDFNAWAEGACVRVLEEIRVTGTSRSTVMDKLKPMITNSCIEVVRKGQDGRPVMNVTNYIAATNHLDALAIDEGDRRWGILRTPFASRDEMLAKHSPEYFRRLVNAVEGFPGVIRGWLLNVDLSDFDPKIAPPMSAAKLEMINASRSPADADIREAISLGGEGISPDIIATDCLGARVKELGGRSINTSAMANILRESGWVRCNVTVKWRDKNRRVYYRPAAVPDHLTGSALTAHLRMMLDDADRLRSDDEKIIEEMPW